MTHSFPTLRSSDLSAEADQFSIQASAPLPSGTQNLGFVFIPDSTKPGSGGILTMTANGQSIGQGRIGRVSVLTAGPGETFDIGDDNGRPVMDYAGTRSEEHTSELQSLMRISYAVFCLKQKNIQVNDYKT